MAPIPMISNYYKYDFVSPVRLFAKIKQELNSFFETGAITDLLFPIWTDDCLSKFNKSTYKIQETILNIKSSAARLPDDFVSVREAWLVTSVERSRQLPNAHYLQTLTRIDADGSTFCDRCSECENPEIIRVVYKSTMEVIDSFRREYLLKPGNISVKNEHCSLDCLNIGSTAPDSFDVRDNKFVVNFTDGAVNLIYYAKEYDEKGNQLIPDNIRIKNYIEMYIKYKLFEQLHNQSTDETFNQTKSRRDDYSRMHDEALILAESELKKKTVYERRHAIAKTMNRNNKYIIR
jgi:hypothetical protein